MTALGHVESLPFIQIQSSWVRDAASACPDCGWPIGAVGHEVNCCEVTP